jgi:flagellin-like protein
MTRTPPRRPMRNPRLFRRARPAGANDERGLAEIVGTLMLVLIVVAAATAFSFFVAATEQTNLAQQTALHMKNLENVTIQAVVNTPTNATFPGSIVIVLSSSDIYATNLTDIAVGGNPATRFCQTAGGCSLTNASDAANFQTFTAAGGSGYVNLTPFTVTAVTINYTSFYIQPFVFNEKSLLVQMGSARGNEFVSTLFPPIPEFGVTSISGWPVLDGTQSYQPHASGSPTASIIGWLWNVKDPTGTASGDGNYSGQQAQLNDQLTPDVVYTVTLTVTNTLGLSASSSETYEVK